jgi:hypothetical protein
LEARPFLPLSESDVNETREKRLNELKIWQIFAEIIPYLLFLLILYVVCYANTNSNSLIFQKQFKNIFISKNLQIDFHNVT